MKIEIRKTCKVCGNKITEKRFRTYCSKECRMAWHNDHSTKPYYQKNKARIILQARERIQSRLKESGKELVQCLICKKWFVQLGSHVVQVHKMTAREYREHFKLEVKRGIVPRWFRELKGNQALSNETYKNLEASEKFRFKKGDKNIGRYKRSPITLERLKVLYKFNKYHANKRI